MNVKLNKYFLGLLSLSLILGIFLLNENGKTNLNNTYLNRVEKIIGEFHFVEEVLDSEIKNYLENNTMSKYSIKEIRDTYVNMRSNIFEIINDIDVIDYENLNEEYLRDILEDMLEVINNDFLLNSIFNSNDETIIVNLQHIMDEFRKVLNKYNVFKLNFGIIDI